MSKIWEVQKRRIEKHTKTKEKRVPGVIHYKMFECAYCKATISEYQDYGNESDNTHVCRTCYETK